MRKKVIADLHADNERLRAAIRSTATDGTYDEIAIRKVVSFELAELIVEARTGIVGGPCIPNADTRAAMAELETGDSKVHRGSAAQVIDDILADGEQNEEPTK